MVSEFTQQPLPFGKKLEEGKRKERIDQIFRQVAKSRRTKRKILAQQALPLDPKQEAEKPMEQAKAAPSQAPDDGVFSFYEPVTESERKAQGEIRKIICDVLMVDSLGEVSHKFADAFQEDLMGALADSNLGYTLYWGERIQIGKAVSSANDGSYDSGR